MHFMYSEGSKNRTWPTFKHDAYWDQKPQLHMDANWLWLCRKHSLGSWWLAQSKHSFRYAAEDKKEKSMVRFIRKGNKMEEPQYPYINLWCSRTGNTMCNSCHISWKKIKKKATNVIKKLELLLFEEREKHLWLYSLKNNEGKTWQSFIKLCMEKLYIFSLSHYTKCQDHPMNLIGCRFMIKVSTSSTYRTLYCCRVMALNKWMYDWSVSGY